MKNNVYVLSFGVNRRPFLGKMLRCSFHATSPVHVGRDFVVNAGMTTRASACALSHTYVHTWTHTQNKVQEVCGQEASVWARVVSRCENTHTLYSSDFLQTTTV